MSSMTGSGEFRIVDKKDDNILRKKNTEREEDMLEEDKKLIRALG